MLCYHSIGRTWSNFFPPLSLCSLSLPVRFLGSIIRCMRRLEELLRQMCQAAKAIGNTELENKFALGIYSFPLITNALNQKLAFITYSCSYRKRFARYTLWAYLVIHKPAWWNELQPFSWNFTALTRCLPFFFFSPPNQASRRSSVTLCLLPVFTSEGWSCCWEIPSLYHQDNNMMVVTEHVY